MKKTALISFLALALTAGASAQSWATKWDWPIQPIHQQFNVGEDQATGMDVGGAGIYWDVLKQADSPFVRSSAAEPAVDPKKQASATASQTPAVPAPKS